MPDLKELNCPRCGGSALEETGNGKYHCLSCERNLVSEAVTKYHEVLNALDQQRREDVNRLKRTMWEKAQKENVFNAELQSVCEKILALVDDDLYACFYLATCKSDPSDLISCLSKTDVREHAEDIPLFLNYLINALRPEWFLPVANLIDRAYMGTEERVYWRDKYDQKAQSVDDGVFDPQINRDVFVAYSSKDMPAVEKLVNVLEENGLTCFLAARNMQHGSGAVDQYYQYIYEALEHCRTLVFVSSSNSRNAQCDAYRHELRYLEAHRPDILRVEYLLEPYIGKALERNFKDFFKDLDWCESPEKVACRVFDLLVKQEHEAPQSPKTDQVTIKTSDEERLARDRAEQEAQAEAQREAEALKKAEEKALWEAEAKAHKAAERKAKREAEERARREAEEASGVSEAEAISVSSYLNGLGEGGHTRTKESVPHPKSTPPVANVKTAESVVPRTHRDHSGIVVAMATLIPAALILVWLFWLLINGTWNEWQWFIAIAVPVIACGGFSCLVYKDEEYYLIAIIISAVTVIIANIILFFIFQEAYHVIGLVSIISFLIAYIYFYWFVVLIGEETDCDGREIVPPIILAGGWIVSLLFVQGWENWQVFLGVVFFGTAFFCLGCLAYIDGGGWWSLTTTGAVLCNLGVAVLIALNFFFFLRFQTDYAILFYVAMAMVALVSFFALAYRLENVENLGIPILQLALSIAITLLCAFLIFGGTTPLVEGYSLTIHQQEEQQRAEQEQQDHIQKGEIQITYEAKDFEGKKPEEVTEMLVNAGFQRENIQIGAYSEECLFGWIHRPDTVKSVTIDGNTEFTAETFVSPNVEITLCIYTWVAWWWMLIIIGGAFVLFFVVCGIIAVVE